MNETSNSIPQGAIWVKNFKLRASISAFISTRDLECPGCKHHYQDELDEIEEGELNETIVNHVMTVKIKTVREKYIALYNPKKSLSTHPDYFLYVYQAFTGAPAVYPFNDGKSGAKDRNTVTIKGQDGVQPSPCDSTRTFKPTSDTGADKSSKSSESY